MDDRYAPVTGLSTCYGGYQIVSDRLDMSRTGTDVPLRCVVTSPAALRDDRRLR